MDYCSKFLMSFLFCLVFGDAMCFTITNTLAVTAIVGGNENCSFGSMATMKFPDYYPFNPNSSKAVGTMTITCLSNLTYNIGMGEGGSLGATEKHRFLTQVGGTQKLEYKLFQDANCQQGCGTVMGKTMLHRVAKGTPEVITIYGEIPSNQKVEAGTYLDQVTISIIL